ncbi:MAG: DUF1461 domain-containing protein [Anaerolineae bacterium]|nr:DUF1461 domain-containing protein [Anaerolineae bacterium]
MTERGAGLRRALGLIVTVLAPIVLVLGSIRLVMSHPALVVIYHLPGMPPDPYGFTLEDRLRLAPGAVDYLIERRDDDFLRAQQAAEGVPLYTEREIGHLRDVQIVTGWAMLALAAALALLFAITLVMARSAPGRAALARGFMRGGGVMLFLLGALLVFILIDWNRFFDSFHALFFAEGSWRFLWSDSLIRLFPITFWQYAALAVGGLSALGGLIALALGWWAARRASGPARAADVPSGAS